MNVSIHRPSRGKGKRSANYVMFWHENGKLCKKSTFTRDKDAAKLIAKEHERRLALEPEGLHDPYKPHAKMTWADARAKFDAYCAAKFTRSQTAGAYQDSLRVFERVAKPKLLRDADGRLLANFAAERAKSVKADTIKKDLRHIRVMLNWAHEQHFLRVVPRFAGLFPHSERKLPVVVPPADYEKLLAAIPEAELRHVSADWLDLFVRIAHAMGPRRGEILNLKWGSVDFQNLTLFVEASTSKGRGDRAVPFGLSLAASLAFWWQAAGEPGDGQLVLPLASEKVRRIYDDWERVCKLAGVAVRFKDFRSTCGSELLNSGTPTALVQSVLGHASIATTERYYLSPSQEAMRAAMERRNA